MVTGYHTGECSSRPCWCCFPFQKGRQPRTEAPSLTVLLSFHKGTLTVCVGAPAGKHRHWHAPDQRLSTFGNTHPPGCSEQPLGGTHMERGQSRGTPASPARSPLVISEVADVIARSPSHPRPFLFNNKNGRCEGIVKSITFSGFIKM